MPGTQVDVPTVPMSFANNFWGKDDAGVQPLLERMHCSKTTSEELKSFYKSRAEIEDEYARKLLSLCRKPLGQNEAGTLKASLDTMRGEVESMGKAHKSVAEQMKTELEEPMAAFAGMMKERRKIVQGGIEKLLKVKVQQSHVLNKTRDKYEQDCLRIKGYLAQGHMVMGQEERKNKAKLEKTQIQMSASEGEYKNAVAALEETTGRWNRDWKAACDKFQDLEEERLDFTKSSLWTFANIASTVCVTDDASCEKIRLSLENCEVEKDIASFIDTRGTGQEIPEPPRFINFCRDDVSDTASNFSEDDSYSVAQFPRTINPAYRTSSPQPSTFESHNDPDSDLARSMGLGGDDRGSRENTPKASQQPPQQAQDFRRQAHMQSSMQHPPDLQPVPYNENPHEGMTMYCRTDTAPSDRSSNPSPIRPGSSDRSDISAPTSMSSVEPPMQTKEPEPSSAKDAPKKKSGFFSNSPFRRRSKSEKSRPPSVAAIANNAGYGSQSTSPNKSGAGISARDFAPPADDLEPVDPRANFQLNVGNNVFDVASPDSRRKPGNTNLASTRFDNEDPIAAALAELKGVTGRDKSSAVRTSADRYHGLATPQPGQQMHDNRDNRDMGKTPPPGYDMQSGSSSMGGGNGGPSPAVRRLDAPQPAHTAASMTATTRKYVGQNADMYRGASGRPGSGNANMTGAPRSASPLPMRSASPRPGLAHQQQQQNQARHHSRQGSGVSMGEQRRGSGMSQGHSEPLRRSGSPNPYGQNAWAATGASSTNNSPTKPYGQQGGYGPPNGGGNGGYSRSRHASPNEQRMRGASPQPQFAPNEQRMRGASPQPQFARNDAQRPGSANMALQLSNGAPQDARGGALGRPVSYYGGAGSGYAPQNQNRERSKSLAGPGQFTRNGTPILYQARAMYAYTAAIAEELSFAKGETLGVTRLQDDGWWEAEVLGRNGRMGLVPSNYLQRI